MRSAVPGMMPVPRGAASGVDAALAGVYKQPHRSFGLLVVNAQFRRSIQI
jgi:hypothetical protein